jgi:beta-lactamase class A
MEIMGAILGAGRQKGRRLARAPDRRDPAGMTKHTDWGALSHAIAASEAGGAVLGVAAIGPDGARFGHREERRVRAASTVKIAVMIELFRRIDAGALSLEEKRVVAAADKTPGSGVISHLHDGIRLTLGDLLYLMMSISDNTATNLLIDRVGMAEVNATMASLGMTNSTLGRRMSGRASEAAQENWATPDDYALAVTALFDGTAASPEACGRMIGVLEQQQNNRRIARLLPREDRPRWGSKTGSLESVVNDVGFIMTAHGPLVIAVFCEAVEDPHEGERMIGEVAAAALACVS